MADLRESGRWTTDAKLAFLYREHGDRRTDPSRAGSSLKQRDGATGKRIRWRGECVPLQNTDTAASEDAPAAHYADNDLGRHMVNEGRRDDGRPSTARRACGAR